MQLYRAVVEDNKSPNKDGRVRVRIHGIHTEKNENSGEAFEFVKTSDLPWAEVMGGAAFGLVGGVGLSNILQQGTWVWVTLENDDPNYPIVIGTITGKISESPTGKYDSGEGFVDPEGLMPRTARSSEHDINRLARNEDLSGQYYDNPCPILGLDTTIHDKINNTLDVQSGKTDGISGADVSQTEPNSTSDASVYPNNTVLETSSGHVIEMDDSEGNERLRVYHRTGSYIEIKPDGTFVQKSVNTDSASHYIHMSDVEEHIAKGVKRYIEDNIDEIIDGGIKRNVKMDFFNHVGGLFKIQADGNILIDGDVKIDGMLDVRDNIACRIGGITAQEDIRSIGGGIEDSVGRLNVLRDNYDAHYHIGNLGVQTSVPIKTDTRDPEKYEIDPWQNGEVGFK